MNTAFLMALAKSTFYTLLFFLSLFITVAQQPNHLEVKGLVLDDATGKPLAFATIGLGHTTLGTATNDDGAFVFRFPAERLPDSLYVSYVGYQAERVWLTAASLGKPLTLRLTPVTISLNEVTVTAPDPKALIKHAWADVAVNYESRPLMMQGFYRETIQQNDSLISLAEAILSIYKASYTDPSQQDQLQLLKGRKSQNVAQSDLLKTFSFSGGLRVDFVKMGIHPLQEQNFGLYDYALGELVTNDRDTVYVIAFDQKDGVKLPLLKGKVYLDFRSLAFTGIEYGYSPKGMPYANQYTKEQQKKMKKADFHVRNLSAQTRVHFRREGTKYYLSNAVSESVVQITRSKGKRIDRIAYRADILVTDRTTANVQPIPPDKQLKSWGPDLSRQIGKDYDHAFWESYNYILPPADIRTKARQLLGK